MKPQLIFIAYFFFPNREVGANRIRFWINYLKQYHPGIEPVVITATPFSGEEKLTEQQYFVPESSPGPLGLIIRDQGLRWRKPLESFLRKKDFNNVLGSIITGGPFMHFSLAPKLRKFTGAPVALDFRDPFSGNNRFHDTRLKKWIKAYFERSFIRGADLVVSVNRDYFEVMAGYDGDKRKFHIIPNGFDEVLIDQARKDPKAGTGKNHLRLILTGKYYADAPAQPTFEAIRELRSEGIPMEFVHFGSAEIPVNPDLVPEFVHEMGVRDYSEVALSLVQSDIGVLIIAGVDQNTPTKVFDYIGAELPVLIITAGELYSGNAHLVTRDYPLVKWCKNDKIDIKRTLKEMAAGELKVSYPERYKYSRRHGLEALLKLFIK